MSPRGLAVTALGLAALLAACTGGDAPPAVEVPPRPSLERLDPEARTRLAQAADDLTAAIERGEAGADAWGSLGMLYHAHDLREAAAACYERARALDGDAFEWPYLLAQLRRAGGEPQSARAALERALELDPDHVPALVLAGELAFEAGDDERARQRLERVLEIDPACAPALATLGRIALRQGRYALAAERLERALELAPWASNLRYPLAMAYRGLDDAERASEQLARHGEVKPRVPDPLMERVRGLGSGARVHQERGTAAARAGRYAEAVAEFRQAVERSPDDPVLRKHLALAAYLGGDEATARRELAAALERDPTDAEANLHLGVIDAQAGDDAAAMPRLRQAVESDPGLKPARLNLAAALQRAGRHADSLPHYERVIEIDPANASARLGRAFARIATGRHAAARDGLVEDLGVLPDQPAFAHALARLLACSPDEDVRDGARAAGLMQRVAERVRTAEVAETIAMTLAEQGRFEEAARWQQGAIEAARRGGAGAVARRMENALARYRSGRKCERPWSDDDPVFSPPPVATVVPAETG